VDEVSSRVQQLVDYAGKAKAAPKGAAALVVGGETEAAWLEIHVFHMRAGRLNAG
jgi:hypothetical protein